jgi:hypothetical protein
MLASDRRNEWRLAWSELAVLVIVGLIAFARLQLGA